MRHLFLLLLVVGFYGPLGAQSSPVAQLSLNQQLPAELLKSRSVVIVDLPATSKKVSWEATAKELHQGLRNMGVDPVAYYELGNVRSGPDAIKGFSGIFNSAKSRM
ncbi:hypothetical protein [Cesiribacter andamanensis]|uniref:Uncharacterized protein n=1 Tax=Cesiribacter andamanensis AMV16 TaxID=1279009 RepID=M7NC10_9BACT|nr:hypothetical protein [Cesiribacter andamanensis]EMR04711.1 hypothetical protein ADICEAN_00163 [Cesiribacter andamanensis AMV16]